jgi:hypothetical protein
VYDRVSKTNVLDLAWNASKVKKIVLQENSFPLPEFFDSIVEEEAWIKIKIDQIAAQFIACGLSHESPILLNFFHNPFFYISSNNF